MVEGNRKMNRLLVYTLIVVIFVFHTLIAQEKKSTPAEKKPLVTFIELGSVKCIPCRMMQPVMKAVEEKYGDQIRVIFYDVWQDNQRPYAKKYGIRLIPTQVFLGEDGAEIMRHEGFFPEKDIDSFLQLKGLKPKFAGKE
jgi:thioredoxin 1